MTTCRIIQFGEDQQKTPKKYSVSNLPKGPPEWGQEVDDSDLARRPYARTTGRYAGQFSQNVFSMPLSFAATIVRVHVTCFLSSLYVSVLTVSDAQHQPPPVDL